MAPSDPAAHLTRITHPEPQDRRPIVPAGVLGVPPGTVRTCDISDLKAPEDKSVGPFSAEAWNMKGSRLDLHDLVFHGVVTVDTAAGPRRVLKFSAASVTTAT